MKRRRERRREERKRRGRRGMEDRSGRAGRVTYKKNAMDDFFFFISLPFPKTEGDRAERPRTEPRDRLVLSCRRPRTTAAEGKGGGGGG